MSQLFSENLLKLDFDASPQGHRSLLLVSQLNDKDLDVAEIFALEDAKIFQADAVYFRRFPDSRPPLPQIYLYDNTQGKLSEDDLANVHRNLWSNCRIPMFIVIEKTTVAIFDTRKPVKVSGVKIETKPFDKILIATDAIKNYSRKLFDSGIFWETQKAKGHFLESTSAYRDLIDNLKFIRNEFLKTARLPKPTAHKLLVFAVLIKYLEERGNADESLFAKNFFQEFNAQNFCDVLRQKGMIVSLFDKLSQHFNGKIFEWSNYEERETVANTDLTQLADFLDADIELQSGQYSFWRRYAFNHLPVELISTVYETFLSGRKDAVYTPEFLVNTLLDEVMPLNDYKKTAFKTVDVSCGSGVFLVGAFKRLVQRYRYSKYKQTGQLVKPSDKTLLNIIKDNIFGRDIESDAVRLTVFSLCLALCDELTPKQIWTELKFDDTFHTNFQAENFFDFLEYADLGTWDLVVGNPPFTELSLNKDEQGNYYYYDKDQKVVKLNKEIGERATQKIYPQNQLALMFLDQAPYLLKENALLCLILPAAPLLYNNSPKFREHFFKNNQVLQILDFTNLDSILFTANVPTAALFARKQANTNKEPVIHITIRRTKSVEERLFFEVDKYDIHYVSQQKAMHDKHIWKCNLLGGGRLNNLISRLSELPSIKSFINKKGWISGEGYIIGSPISKRKVKAEYITGKPTLPTEAFGENSVDESKIRNETAILFNWPRKKGIYEPPHLLIKENMGVSKIPTYFSDQYLTFKDSVIGIAAHKSERTQLLKLANAFERYKEIYKIFITATSNEYLVGRATSLLKQDIMNLPYSENDEDLTLSFAEQVLCNDVLSYYIDLLSKGSKAKVNRTAPTDALKDYSEVFTKALNSIYEQADKHFYLKRIYDWDEYYITEFNYGPNSEKIEIETVNQLTDNVKSLIETRNSSNYYLLKTIKIYERNKVYFVKPKPLRYWLRSISLRDADEVFSDLLKAGY